MLYKNIHRKIGRVHRKYFLKIDDFNFFEMHSTSINQTIMKYYRYSYKFILLLTFTTFMLTNCDVLPSAYPLYEPDDLVTVEGISGTWTNEKGTQTYKVYSIKELHTNQALRDSLDIQSGDDTIEKYIERGLSHAYIITEMDSSEVKAVYLGGIVKIGNQYFADLYKYQFFNASDFLYPIHLFFKAKFEHDKIILHGFSVDWINKLIKNQKVRIKHVNSMNNFLLTAQPSVLQKFIAKYADNPKAFTDETIIYIKASNP